MSSLDETYSIQSADMSIKAEGSWGTPAKMTDLFSSYDWDVELALQAQLGDSPEACPPGLILLRESGVFLHLCPNADGTVTIHCTQALPRKIFGFLKFTWDKHVTKERASHALALRAIPKFMADDENWLQLNINED